MFTIVVFSTLCLVHGAAVLHLQWPKAVVEVARMEFASPEILLLIVDPLRNFKDVGKDPVEDLIQELGKHWALTVFDGSCQASKTQFGNLKLQKVRQTVAIIESRVVITPGLFSAEVYRWTTNPVWSARASILTVVVGRTESLDLAQVIVSELWRQTKAASVAVMAAGEEQVELYTSVPYSPQTHCEPHALSAGRWHQDSPLNHTLFPKRTGWNLNQCKIVAASTEFTIFSNTKDPNNPFTEGIEVLFLQDFARSLNFTIGFIRSPPGEKPWVSVVNGNVVGIIGRVYRHEADIAFGGTLLTWERSVFADPVESVTDGAHIVWAGPLPHRVPSWRDLYKVFDLFMWLGTLLIVMVAAVFLWALSKLSAVEATMISVGHILYTPVVYPSTVSTRPLTRFFLALYFVYVLNVTAAYQSGMFRVLTSGHTVDSPESPMEAVREGYVANIFPSVLSTVRDETPEFYQYITTNNLVNWTYDHVSVLKRIAQKKKEIVFLTESIIAYETNRLLTHTTCRPLVRILKETHGQHRPAFYTTHDHPLQPELQMNVLRLREGGWGEHYLRKELEHALSDASSVDIIIIEGDPDMSKLNMEQLSGAFAVFSCLLLIASVIFAAELTYKVILARKRFKMFKKLRRGMKKIGKRRKS